MPGARPSSSTLTRVASNAQGTDYTTSPGTESHKEVGSFQRISLLGGGLEGSLQPMVYPIESRYLPAYKLLRHSSSVASLDVVKAEDQPHAPRTPGQGVERGQRRSGDAAVLIEVVKEQQREIQGRDNCCENLT